MGKERLTAWRTMSPSQYWVSRDCILRILGCALTLQISPYPQAEIIKLNFTNLGKERLELSTLAGLAPKASAYTNSATYPNTRIIAVIVGKNKGLIIDKTP